MARFLDGCSWTGPVVSALDVGCMGMSEFYGPSDPAEVRRTLESAIERDDRGWHVDNRPAYAKAACEASLRRLKTEYIDVLYAHRIDPGQRVEDMVGAMADLVRAGKVRAIGLSEAGPATIRRAHAVHPLAAVETEHSLFSRDPEREIIPTCRDLGIAFVPYSPLSRGLLTGTGVSGAQLSDDDFRKGLPRFQTGNSSATKRSSHGFGRSPSRRAVARWRNLRWHGFWGEATTSSRSPACARCATWRKILARPRSFYRMRTSNRSKPHPPKCRCGRALHRRGTQDGGPLTLRD